MSIRRTQKNRLITQELTLVTASRPEPPTSKHPLVFWTQHKERPIEVDLREFAEGKHEKKIGLTTEKTFSGRPQLIQQLRPILEAHLILASPVHVKGCMTVLRKWWSLLDSFERNSTLTGNPVDRVDDVRHLTVLHREAARNDRMERQAFSRFRSWVDAARLSLGSKPTYWIGLEHVKAEKYIPPLEQREEVRQALKRECLRVIDYWEKCDRLEQLQSEPEQPEEATLWMGLRHLRVTQKRTGTLVPSLDGLNRRDLGGHEGWCFHHIGMRPTAVLYAGFACRHDALAIFSQCIATTGWNVAVMLGLDVTTEFLRDHPKDDPADHNRRWILSGIKERAQGSEQTAIGPWKASYLAGNLIKRYMQRVEPLREILKTQLKKVETEYADALQEAPGAPQTKALFTRITKLRTSVRSVWLYLDSSGRVQSLGENFTDKNNFDSAGEAKTRTYLEALVADLNAKRRMTGKDAIPFVTYRDFRLWFADYLYRSSLGNLLVVKIGLGHKQIGTTQGYVNTNLANYDAESKGLEFQEILTEELGLGRIDLTVLAYKVRHGEFDKKKEEMLAELRRLPKSRQGVACRDPWTPPAHVKATPGQPCDSQRCLLCKQHAVLLPESVDGIAMREAELKAMRERLPLRSFVEGGYETELENQEQALRLFEPHEVAMAREKWSKAISEGRHLVPGLPIHIGSLQS